MGSSTKQPTSTALLRMNNETECITTGGKPDARTSIWSKTSLVNNSQNNEQAISNNINYHFRCHNPVLINFTSICAFDPL